MEKTLKQHLIELALIYLHGELSEDNEWIAKVCDELDCTEFQLFSAFEDLAQEHQIELTVD